MSTDNTKLKEELAQLLEEKQRRIETDKFHNFYFQEHKIDDRDMDVSRKNYKAHLDFFRAGAKYRQRAFVAGNRTGKSVAGAYELVCHLTGDYPDWWEGRRFDKPIRACAAGKDHNTTRDVIQYELLGPWGEFGTGMIPKVKLLDKPSAKAGVPRAIQDITVKHISGGTSTLTLKAYDQGQESFMGTFYHVMWFDEECKDMPTYEECLMRTMSVDGIMYTTFTPLLGMSPVILSFMPKGRFPPGGIVRDEDDYPTGQYIVNCTWDDVPHIKDEDKEELLKTLSPHQREARSRGIPTMGSGAVYPVFEEDIVVDPFPIPSWFKRAYGLDFGWNRTAAVWGAQDPDTGIIYLYAEHYLGKQSFANHAQAIQARGDWIIGACDPAGGGVNQSSGMSTIQEYEMLGLNLYAGAKNFKINAVEPGIAKVLTKLESGQLKVFSTLGNWLNEFRMYRREENSRGELEIYKRHDHLMDAMRYLIMAWDEVALDLNDLEDSPQYFDEYNRSSITGY